MFRRDCHHPFDFDFAACHRPVRRQGDPVGALRAALTARQADGRRRRNSGRSFAMCIASTCLILATFGSSNVVAEEAQKHRLLAQDLNLVARPESDIQLQIWQDKLPDLVKQREALRRITPNLKLPMSTEVFTTSFKDGDRTLVVSALNFRCATAQAIPHEIDCPARVAEVRAGSLRILKQLPEFPVIAVRGTYGFDASSNQNQKYKTVVTFDRESHRLIPDVVYDGEVGQRDPINLQ
ncbi:hypothetical protein IY145_23510 [Methylosinus sp. H3A]|uniref:hypothetical protein n=1 Tax=Methylosinus sp. H3A TaxID=2785786 RepID=UPI0018C20343|nr:hypothetical protein [Methylosinus sp. H3A]MBG0812317.1 hypothetical protein [Methylosinus sp. H3A]